MSTTRQEQRILEVAKQLFTQRGFSNVAIRDICRAADITPPTVYYYFKNKEALFDAVVRGAITMTEFIGRLNEDCRKAKSSESQIRVFARTYLSYFPEDLINVGLYVRRSTELDPIGRRTLSVELARIQSLLTGVIRKGIAHGEFRNTDPRMATECLLGMMNRFIFQRIHFQRNYNATEAASYLTDFFLRAMRLQ
jgi:AcrR family transcriptional regulator